MSAERTSAALLAALAVALSAAEARGAAHLAAAAPRVQMMIVGRSGAVLSPARTVLAGATTLRVGGRRCAVAAATPLAALASDRRAGGPGFAVRDYGHCGSSAANSGQLFVYSIGGQRNSGQSGWEYKVERVAGSTGAADPSGPLGNGRRIRGGQRVLWFWCHASAGGCQRTLTAFPAASAVSAGGSLLVSVAGYDNEGRAAAVSGAVVTLGADFASTDMFGRARLIAPLTTGHYALTVTRSGLVPSFPETIVVR